MKFGFVGGVNTTIDFGVFTLLTLAGVPYLAAQCVSFLCGNLNSYLMNRKWTFQQKGNGIGREGLKFVSVSLLSLLLTTSLLVWLHQSLQYPLLLSKLLSATAGMMVNYLGSRLWVFVKPQETVETPTPH
ncbi:hypothetical protein CF651_04805 [Paenibacillus rigui]|uniref:GtrA/DPMS transmembrane domain-containing protein n=1 Tax=Paenibacillus rigui TaxID=554312 RepID=A0A229UV88_9BACL|nr:hypothetical protein CF651_04805 [Paenibacillus rigui]